METILTNIKERILKIPENEDIAKEKFFADLGITYGNFKGKAKDKALSSDILAKIVTKYPNYRPIWLLTGEGDMVYNKNQKSDNLIQEPITPYRLRTDHSLEIQEIPLYDREAAASLVALFQDSSAEMQIGTISIPNIPKCDGAVYVTGDSMYPLLKSGDMVLFKQVPDPQKAIFFYGEMYLLAFNVNDDDYIAVKWLQRSDKEGYVKLVSENEHHQPVDIPINSLTAMALIKASIRINAMK